MKSCLGTSTESLLPSDRLCGIKVLSVSGDELAGINMAEALSIPVPAVRRVIKVERGFYIVMDRIYGPTLDEAWAKLGWISTLSTAFQLRRFVKTMRNRTSSVAGAPATGEFKAIWLDDFYGMPAHSTPENITSYFTFWLQYSRSHVPVARGHASPSGASPQLRLYPPRFSTA